MLGPGDIYEVNQAKEMLNALNTEDLLIFDRGYLAYPFIVELIKAGRSFVIRSPKSSSKEIQRMFSEGAPDSAIVEIPLPNKHKKKARILGWPVKIRIGLVRILLSSGEIEVLATSLLSEEGEDGFSVDDLKEVYRLRWGVETFFSKIKGRLGLENFTGKTVESVMQDFWSTILISNVETIMTEDIEQKMNEDRPDENKPVKINKAVSFNVIKKMALDIFFTEKGQDAVFEKIGTIIFTQPSYCKRESGSAQAKNFRHEVDELSKKG